MRVMFSMKVGLVAFAIPFLRVTFASSADSIPVATVLPKILPDASRYMALPDEQFVRLHPIPAWLHSSMPAIR